MLRLTKLRESKGWSKFKLGAKSGVHPSVVGKIEGRRIVPYDPMLEKLARALGVKRPKSLLDDVNP